MYLLKSEFEFHCLGMNFEAENFNWLILWCFASIGFLQVNGNHETMNVEGDYRFVDAGGFDECSDFLDYLSECKHNWEEAFVGWVGVSGSWKEDRKMSQTHWDPWNLVKVHISSSNFVI